MRDIRHVQRSRKETRMNVKRYFMCSLHKVLNVASNRDAV
jgi:hypothetical protein